MSAPEPGSLSGQLRALAGAVARAVERRGPSEATARIVEVLHGDHPGGADAAGDGEALGTLRRVFDLDELDLAVLVAAAAPELSANFGAAMSALRGDPHEARASVGLVLELTGSGWMDVAARRRLTPAGALVRHGLVEVAGDHPFLLRLVRVPDRVTAFLLGDHAAVDPLVEPLLTTAVAVPSEEAGQIAQAIAAGAALVWLHELPAGAATAAAAGAFGGLEIAWLAVDVGPVTAAELPGVLRAAAREAGLRSAGLIVVGADVVAAAGAGGLAILFEAVVPVVLVGRSPWNPAWSRDLPPVVTVPPLPPELRRALWGSALGLPADDDGPTLAGLESLRLNPEQIVRVVAGARTTAHVRDVELDLQLVRETARRLSGRHGAGPRHGGVGGPTLADIALPPDAERSMRELIGWFRHRDRVLRQDGVTGAAHSGRGISALFAGGPGTGKTLAAHVVAGELGLDLLTVDLSSIVDKYIGETEKNLETVFREAESLNVLLFFDEADALFGSRSEVKDARDRYANQEVAYLLQRMETFDGVAVLATNLRGNLDPAFSRRLQFIVHFPDPDRPTRQRLWTQHLAALVETDPADPVDVDTLAERFEISGGAIRNIVMAAAYSSASTGNPVGHTTLTHAVEREFAKLGKRPPRLVPPPTG